MLTHNSTDLLAAVSNTTEYIQANATNLEEDSTWTTRAQEYCDSLLCYSLGMILSLLVIYLTLFSKQVVGDYKWFILNQGIANFINALGGLLFTLVVEVILGDDQFYRLYFCVGGCTPLWFTLFYEIVCNELEVKFGVYAQMTTLFATILNRWMAIALPNHYQTFMTPRLIFLYCSLCYLLLLPVDPRLIGKLPFSDGLMGFCLNGPFILPWCISIVLSILIYIKLSMHLRSMTSTMDMQRIKEYRNILYAIIFQIVVLLIDKVPTYILMIANMFGIDITEDFEMNPITNILFIKIGSINTLLSSVYSCFVILLTMRPYREALSSLISPITKFCKHFVKKMFAIKKTDQNAILSTPVINIQPGGAQSDAVTSNFVSPPRVSSQIAAVAS